MVVLSSWTILNGSNILAGGVFVVFEQLAKFSKYSVVDVQASQLKQGITVGIK
jgi:hypothetical protein